MANELKKQKVEAENTLKEWLVNYVGNNLNPENEQVTVEMIVEVVAKEFPEFLFVVAEENFLRGYEQALDDINALNKKDDQNAQVHQNNA